MMLVFAVPCFFSERLVHQVWFFFVPVRCQGLGFGVEGFGLSRTQDPKISGWIGRRVEAGRRIEG